MSLHGDVPITCYNPRDCRRAWHGKTHCDMRTNLCVALAPDRTAGAAAQNDERPAAEQARLSGTGAGFFGKHGKPGMWLAGLALLLVVAVLLSRRRR